MFNFNFSKIPFSFKIKIVKNLNQGDLSSNTLFQINNSLFNNSKTSIVEKEFFSKLLEDFIQKLNENLKNEKNLNENTVKFVLSNNYLNVYLKKEMLDILSNNNQSEKKNKYEYGITPIGIFHSCFPEKFSIPRQGRLIEKTKGKIVFDSKIVGDSSLDGVEEFEYFWVIYLFHLHTDFKGAKTSPPKLESDSNKNEKRGIFATRTPHRVNPIGLTLVKLVKVENNEMFISGIDMVEGTPIVDVKPYHHVESVIINKYPNWIKEADKDVIKNSVSFNEESLTTLKNLIDEKKLEFYTDFNEIKELITELLEIDPHSKHTKKKNECLLYVFYLDRINIIYEFNTAEKKIKVIDIEYVEQYKKKRNKEWLDEYKSKQTKI